MNSLVHELEEKRLTLVAKRNELEGRYEHREAAAKKFGTLHNESLLRLKEKFTRQTQAAVGRNKETLHKIYQANEVFHHNCDESGSASNRRLAGEKLRLMTVAEHLYPRWQDGQLQQLTKALCDMETLHFESEIRRAAAEKAFEKEKLLRSLMQRRQQEVTVSHLRGETEELDRQLARRKLSADAVEPDHLAYTNAAKVIDETRVKKDTLRRIDRVAGAGAGEEGRHEVAQGEKSQSVEHVATWKPRKSGVANSMVDPQVERKNPVTGQNSYGFVEEFEEHDAFEGRSKCLPAIESSAAVAAADTLEGKASTGSAEEGSQSASDMTSIHLAVDETTGCVLLGRNKPSSPKPVVPLCDGRLLPSSPMERVEETLIAGPEPISAMLQRVLDLLKVKKQTRAGGYGKAAVAAAQEGKTRVIQSFIDGSGDNCDDLACLCGSVIEQLTAVSEDLIPSAALVGIVSVDKLRMHLKGTPWLNLFEDLMKHIKELTSEKLLTSDEALQVFSSALASCHEGGKGGMERRRRKVLSLLESAAGGTGRQSNNTSRSSGNWTKAPFKMPGSFGAS
ncbi:unnamed protein product [Chrysoparadoxa australica]